MLAARNYLWLQQQLFNDRLPPGTAYKALLCRNGIAYRPHFLYSRSRPVTSIGAFLKRSGNWTSEKGAIVSLHPRLQQRNHNPSLLFPVFLLRPLHLPSSFTLLSPYNAEVLRSSVSLPFLFSSYTSICLQSFAASSLASSSSTASSLVIIRDETRWTLRKRWRKYEHVL